MPTLRRWKTDALLPPHRLLAGLRWLIVVAAILLALRDGAPAATGWRVAAALGGLLGQQTITLWLAGRPRWAGGRRAELRLAGDILVVGVALAVGGDDTGALFLLLALCVVEATLLGAGGRAWRLALLADAVLAAAQLANGWTTWQWTSHAALVLGLEVALLLAIAAVSATIHAAWQAETAHVGQLALLDELSLLLADPRQLDDVLGRLVELVPPALHVQACVVAVDEPGGDRRIWANLGADTTALIDEALLAREATASLRAANQRGVLRYTPGDSPYAAIYLLPLAIDDRAGGLLSVARVTPEPFGPRDQSLFESLARHAAQAVRNARLHQLEARAMEATRQVEQFKSEMLASVSHEFRLPLASISLAVEALLTQPGAADPDGTDARLLRNIQRSATRLGGFVQDLLDLARLEANQLELRQQPCDLAAIARTVFAHTETLFALKEQRATLSVALAACPVVGDALRLEQVISNLLANAQQYTPEGGAIHVALVPAETLHDTGPCGPEPAGRAVALGVRDSGPGIPPEERELIFERFGRGSAGRRRSGGTGLGLYIARSVVERHGGCLWVGENADGGSTFWCLLPLAAPEDEAESAALDATRADSEETVRSRA